MLKEALDIKVDKTSQEERIFGPPFESDEEAIEGKFVNSMQCQI